MRRGSGRALCALAVALVGWMASPVVAGAETASATIIPVEPGPICADDAATLVWTPPEGVADLTGYQIIHSQRTPGTYWETYTRVGPEQTSLRFTVPFGLSIFLIQAVTSTGTGAPFATANTFGGRRPSPMYWDPYPGPAGVGAGTATVPFAWPGPVTWSTTGGGADTIQVTASPGGATITSAVPTSAYDASPIVSTFTGLTNGVEYTFTAVVSNGCGSSSPWTSAVYVPGVEPTWVEASPPLTVKKNKDYSYRFTATGAPAPTYALVDAPAWLAVNPDGTVSGDPPKGTTSFSYSVVAENGVGVKYPGLDAPPVVAGPFTVTVVNGNKA